MSRGKTLYTNLLDGIFLVHGRHKLHVTVGHGIDSDVCVGCFKEIGRVQSCETSRAQVGVCRGCNVGETRYSLEKLIA